MAVVMSAAFGLLFPSFRAAAQNSTTYTVYFEKYSEWSKVCTWIWDKNDGNRNYTGGTWPGKEIHLSADYPELYSFTFECTASNPNLYCIFNDGNGSVPEGEKAKHQTNDLKLQNGYVYAFGLDTPKCHIDDYVVPVPGENIKVYFDNTNSSWTRPYVYAFTGTPSSSVGTAMSSHNAPGLENIWSCEVPQSASSLIFNDGTTSGSRTSALAAIDGHIYSSDNGGKDLGLMSEYSGPAIDPENPRRLTYWISPEVAGQNDKITLYFDRSKGSRELAATDDIYAWIGVITSESSDDKDWKHDPQESGASWANLTDKFKMKRLSADGNVYSLEMSPTLASWFNMRDDERASKIAVIFRDKTGSIRYDGGNNQYISLQALPVDPSQSPLGAFVSAENNNGTVTIAGSKGGRLMITPYAPDIVKVFTLPASLVGSTDDSARERRSISVVAVPDVTYTVDDTDDEYLIRVAGGVTVSVDKNTCFVTFRDDNTVLLSENGGLVNTPGQRTVNFLGMNDDAFYGAGYNGRNTNIGGTSWTMRNKQTGGWNATWSAPHNICIPYYVSTNGYGVLFDDHYVDAVMTPSSSGSSYTTASANPIAYYFVGGGSMEKAMQNYITLTGYQPLPPFWALGYITSRYGYHSQSEAENVIRRIKDESQLPLDGIVFDLYWQGETNAGMGNLEWYTPKFPNPTAMLADFKSKHVNTVCITEPFFTSDASDNYDYLKKQGFLADEKVGDMTWLTNNPVGLIDASNPDAMKWMGEFYKKHTLAGMAGWWLDLGEPERHFPSNCHHAGGTCNQIHNEFGNLWIEGAYKALTEAAPDMRHLLMPRSGTAGMQRFSTFPWTGDIQRSWTGLQAQVPALVNGSMSGIGYLGSDIGGFCNSDNNSDELYLRWVQLGVFYPMMRTHAQESLTPEPYNRPSIIGKVRDAINLRYAYLPYTYTQAYRYSRYGSPMARPANFADDDKSVLANCKDAYLWGPDIYVAPVINSGTARDITFPEGDWLDMNDFSTIYEGHSTVRGYSAPMDVLPHFMRRGSFVPRYRQDTFTSTAEIDTRSVTVDYFPSWKPEPDTGMIFDDNRTSASTIANGDYTLTTFEGWGDAGSDGSLTVRISREGNGWNGMDAGTCSDILFCIHDYRLAGAPRLARVSSDAPARAAAASTIRQLGSLEEVKAENSADSYAIDGNNLYVRIPRLSPEAGYSFTVTDDGNVTGVDDIFAGSQMTLAYSGGYITYSAPAGTEALALDIFSTTGTVVTAYSALTADGYANQIDLSLPQGMYIARLSGRNASGETITETIKMVVR